MTESKLTQAIIDAAPEGATHVLLLQGMYLKRSEDGKSALQRYGTVTHPNDPWEVPIRWDSSIGRTAVALHLPPKPSAQDAEWRPMTEKPERLGLIQMRRGREVFFSEWLGHTYSGAWTTSGKALNNGVHGFMEHWAKYEGWRYASPEAPAAEVTSETPAADALNRAAARGTLGTPRDLAAERDAAGTARTEALRTAREQAQAHAFFNAPTRHKNAALLTCAPIWSAR